MEYESTAYINLGTEMVAKAMRDLTHDSSHTEWQVNGYVVLHDSGALTDDPEERRKEANERVPVF